MNGSNRSKETSQEYFDIITSEKKKPQIQNNEYNDEELVVMASENTKLGKNATNSTFHEQITVPMFEKHKKVLNPKTSESNDTTYIKEML